MSGNAGRRPLRMPMLLCAALLCGAGLAACSDAARPTASSGLEPTFRSHVDAVCSVALAEHDKHPFPLKDFDPRHPRAGELPVVGKYFEQYGGLATTRAKLVALGEPTKDVSAWDSMLRLLGELTDQAEQQVAAAKRADLAAWDASLDAALAMHARLNPVATRLGFTATSDCSRLFG